MSLRSEVKEALMRFLDVLGYDCMALAVCREDWCATGTHQRGLAAARAILEAIDQYEELEVRECRYHEKGHWLRLPDDTMDEDKFIVATQTILRRKQEPEPDVTELAQRAVKAWRRREAELRRRGSCYAEPLNNAMEALDAELEPLAEAVDK
jgi:hypothetical protein